MKRGGATALIVFGAFFARVGVGLLLHIQGGVRGISVSTAMILAAVFLPFGIVSLLFGVDYHARTVSMSVSKAYYLLPIGLALIGAAILYFIFRYVYQNHDSDAARALMMIGVWITVLELVFQTLASAVIFMVFMQL